MVKPVTSSQGLDRRLAQKYKPSIFQEFNSHWDWLGSINFSPDIPHEAPIFEHQPPVYYYVMVSEAKGLLEETYYIFYGVYHPWDPAARHRHDFEGALFVIPKSWPHARYVITRSHHRLLCYDMILSGFTGESITIENGGHGISLCRPDPNYIRYDEVELINMTNKPFRWSKIQEGFGTDCTLPDQWEDQRLYTYYRKHANKMKLHKKHGLDTTKGLFYNRPDIFVEIARERGLFD